jgi:hypothetical protein
MARRSIEQDIDHLYQLPPNDFTEARNALAKELAGEDAKRVKALAKPSAAAWAVNQLHWRDRATYDALISASERLRAAHRAVLGGKKADLRGADADHRAAVKEALTSTLRLAKESGQNISPAAQTDIVRTLERLPSGDAPGRLSKSLSPEGFEALQGMPIRARTPAPTAATTAAKPDRPGESRERKNAQRALEAARTRAGEDKALVARLQKQVDAAERTTREAKSRLDRAQEAEDRLKGELQRAEQSLEQSAKALAQLSDRP